MMLPREDYPMVINTELQQLEFEINKLQLYLDQSEDDAKREFREMIDVMRAKLRQAKTKLKVLEKAADEDWDAAKADLDNTRDALKSMIASAVSQVA